METLHVETDSFSEPAYQFWTPTLDQGSGGNTNHNEEMPWAWSALPSELGYNTYETRGESVCV